MLDLNLSASVSDQLWSTLPVRAKLPLDENDFLQGNDKKVDPHDARRRFRRVRVRGRAALRHKDKFYGVYTIDVSPMGMSFFSPFQLFPKEVVELTFDEYDKLTVEIRRCRRNGDECYMCGGVFVTGPMAPSVYRKFLQSLIVQG
jgi:hypothetical protein